MKSVISLCLKWLLSHLNPKKISNGAIMEIHATIDKDKNLDIKMSGDVSMLLKILMYLEKEVVVNQKGYIKVPTIRVKTQPLNRFKIIGESQRGLFQRLRVLENERENYDRP